MCWKTTATMCSPLNCVQLIKINLPINGFYFSFVHVSVNVSLLEPQEMKNEPSGRHKHSIIVARWIRCVFSSGGSSLDSIYFCTRVEGCTEHKYFHQTTVGDYSLLPATEELHAKECENEDEEEEEEDEGDDGLHGVHQRDDQVSQRRPIP